MTGSALSPYMHGHLIKEGKKNMAIAQWIAMWIVKKKRPLHGAQYVLISKAQPVPYVLSVSASVPTETQ